MPVWSRRCIGGGGIDTTSRFGVSGQLFGIHRYRSESEVGFATEQTRRKNRKAQIAIAVVIASVAGLFVCLLIMDLTQGSETSEHSGARRAPPQTRHISPINSSTDVPGLGPNELNPPLKSISNSPARRIKEDFPIIELDNYQVDNEPSRTTTIPPTTMTTMEEVTQIIDLNKENALVDETTILPETMNKKMGLKSARSLPEERFRTWPGTIAPDAEGSQNGARTSAALHFTGQDAGLAQWSDMQKRSGITPAFDANKWLEAIRTQYQIDKKTWPNRFTESPRNPRPFNPGTDTGQNQFLVVNNRGVVIPNSVQFPDLVKAAAYPQLQTYRYPQTSRNIQEILRFVTSANNPVNRMRQNQWPTAVKKAAKVSGTYLDNYATSTYATGRPEAAYLAGTTATTPGGKPLNGHAYISDPFHPYKPADPTEINHLADNNAGYMDSDLPTHYVYPTKLTKSHLRNQFGSGGKQSQSTPYTTAIFKPFGHQDQVSTSSANVDALLQYLPQQQKRVLPPLSVMLEIYPVSNEDSRTIPFRGTATSSAFRRPGNAISLLQKEPAVRRPVGAAVDTSVASSNVPILTTQSLQFQPQVQQQVPPAFGMTLAGLPTLPGLGSSEAKHQAPRMVVHLNFYPKKNPLAVVPRLRDPSEDLQTALADQGETLTAGVYADYPQRRQLGSSGVRRPNREDNVHTAKENYFPGNSVVHAEFDANSLASVLPKEVLQRFSDFLRGATADSDHQTNYEMTHDTTEEYVADVTEDRDDHEVRNNHDNEDEDGEEYDEDDEEEGKIVPYPEELRRHPPMLRHPERERVPFHNLWRSGGNMSWPDVQYDDGNEEDEGIGEIKGRAVGDASPKLKIMPGKTKVIAVTEDVNEEVKTSTTEKPEVGKNTYKPRRRIIIESSPKNHRMQ